MKKRQLNVVSKYEYSEKFHLPKSISKGVPKDLEQVETEKIKINLKYFPTHTRLFLVRDVALR